ARALRRTLSHATSRLANWSATTSQNVVCSSSFGLFAAEGWVPERTSTSLSGSKGNRKTARIVEHKSNAKSSEYSPVPKTPIRNGSFIIRKLSSLTTTGLGWSAILPHDKGLLLSEPTR